MSRWYRRLSITVIVLAVFLSRTRVYRGSGATVIYLSGIDGRMLAGVYSAPGRSGVAIYRGRGGPYFAAGWSDYGPGWGRTFGANFLTPEGVPIGPRVYRNVPPPL